MANIVHLFDAKVNLQTYPPAEAWVRKDYASFLEDYTITQLIQSIRVMDLTSLVGGETKEQIEKLCQTSLTPLPHDLVQELTAIGYLEAGKPIQTAAVCVYPDCVPYAKAFFKDNVKDGSPVPAIATVTGFPSGAAPIAEKLKETSDAAASGADEIDIVIDKSLVLSGNFQQLHDEISQAKGVCKEAGVKLKVILKTGELEIPDNIYQASLTCMYGGADFIKTSTGKEAVNATIETGVIMTSAIREFNQRTGMKIGFKPAGGIKTADQAIDWMSLMNDSLGSEWTDAGLFRFGASSLLTSIQQKLSDEVMRMKMKEKK